LTREAAWLDYAVGVDPEEGVMRVKAVVLAAASLVLAAALVDPAFGQDKPKPTVQMPQPGVPEIMTIEGNFIRAAYNNEGYAILGYKLANNSLGEEWMLLEAGVTLREGRPSYDLPREAFSMETPDGKTIALATVKEYRDADLRALEARSEIIRDSVNYFPTNASKPCRIGYFAPQESRAMPWDVVELSQDRACVGRLYFKVPGGIKYGQHWLNVKFKESLVRVPFRILTKEEEKLLEKNYKDIRKQVQDAFKKK
jgi:hypothetical protein